MEPAADGLSPDDPRLRDLYERYERASSARADHSLWKESYRRRDLRLGHFRGDNVYLWQLRDVEGATRLKYLLYARYLQGLDDRRLFDILGEDGAFGCWLFDYETLPPVSRDLLDSINELLFLDRAWGLFDRSGFSVLDIGAGYGRLAHRMVHAVPGVAHYYCVDAVPESTYLCDYYLAHRGVVPQAEAVPLDQFEQRLAGRTVDLAVAVHSLSEMPYSAVEAWLTWLADHRVPALMIVPNHPNDLSSLERSGVRKDYGNLLEGLGYRLRIEEPIVGDPDVRALTGIDYRFYFFELSQRGL